MDNKKKGLPVFVGVACVWMGTHFGPGVASGTQVNSFYTQYGLFGVVCSILAMCLLGYALYCSMEFSRLYKTYDYKAWGSTLTGIQWIGVLYDISFIVTIFTALGGSLNAVGSLFSKLLGLNYWVGVLAVVICTMLLCAFGSELVRRSSSYMMFVVLGILALIIIIVLLFGEADFSGSVANAAANLPNSGSLLTAAWNAVLYASFQATVVGNISSVADGLTKRSESKKAAITGIAGNAIMLVVLSLLLFSYTNVSGFESGSIIKEALPIYAILDRMHFQWLTVLYVATVFVAVLSTAVGFSFGGLSRFSKIYNKTGTKSTMKNMIFIGALLLMCCFASIFGILKLVSTGYRILGYINLPIFILTAIIIGRRKISKAYLKEHHVEAPGVDE